MYMTGTDPHIDDGLSKYDNKSIEKTEKKYKLVSIDELIEEKNTTIYNNYFNILFQE